MAKQHKAMRKYACWIFAFGMVCCALIVRFLWNPTKGLYDSGHDQEAYAYTEIEKIASLPPEQQLKLLKQMASLDSPMIKRVVAIDGLAQLNTPDAHALIMEAMHDYASPVRIHAVAAASQLPREIAVPFLVNCLSDHDTDVRQDAINHLRVLKDKRSIKALITLLDDPNIITQQMAMATLRSITGQRFYARFTDPEPKRQFAIRQWKAWYRVVQSRYPKQLQPVPRHPVAVVDAPNLRLYTLDGQQIALRHPPKQLLINFWGTWCGGCQQELPHLIEFHKRYGDTVMVIGIACDEPEGEKGLKVFCKRKGIRYPQVMGTGRIVKAFGIHDVPQTVLIDTRGKIRFWWEGGRDLTTFKRALRLLLTDKSPF